MNIKAIETKFKGYRFRSRLEARWALFLDKLGVQFKYETEGFELGTKKVRYLPDFEIPKWDKYVEIKPRVQLSTVELQKVGLLTAYTGKPTLLVQGDPWPGSYHVALFMPTNEPGEVAPHKVALQGPFVFAVAPLSGRTYLCRIPKEIDKAIPLDFQLFFPLEADMIVDGGKLILCLTGDTAPQIGTDIEQGIHVIIGSMLSAQQVMETDSALSRAYVAARAARFEHGEVT